MSGLFACLDSHSELEGLHLPLGSCSSDGLSLLVDWLGVLSGLHLARSNVLLLLWLHYSLGLSVELLPLLVKNLVTDPNVLLQSLRVERSAT